MEAMKKDGFDTWLQDSLQDHESAIPMGGWQGLHQAKKKKRRFRFLWPFAAAALLVVGASIGYYTLSSSNPNAEIAVKNEPTKPLRQANTSASMDNEVSVNSEPSSINTFDQEIEALPTESESKSAINSPQAVVKYSHNQTAVFGPDSTKTLKKSDTVPVGIIRIVKMDFRLDSLSKKDFIARPIAFDSDEPFSRRRFHGFYAQLIAYTGEMRFNTLDAENLEPNYARIINKSKLMESSLSFGIGTEFSLNPHFALFGGMHFEQCRIEGTYDYAFYSFSNSSVGNTNQSWVSNPQLQSTNYRYDVKITTQRLSIPIMLRYRLHYGSGPLAEIGATYSYSMKTSGDWMDAQDLQPTTVHNDFAVKHHLRPQFGLGYALKIKRSQVALIYQFSPWTASYTPPGGQMGANQHGLKLQWQMPY